MSLAQIAQDPAAVQQELLEGSAQHNLLKLSRGSWLAIALLLGLALRLYYYSVKGGMHYPDEIFQYLEPATWRMNGFAWLPWEFDRGVRNWFLPGYYGSLMEVGRFLGLEGLGLHKFLTLHNTLLSLALIPAGFRLGRAVGRGSETLAVFGGMGFALFPLFGYFAPHTLSELHGLLLSTWAYALWMEGVHQADQPHPARRAVVIGLLLGLSVIVRYTMVFFLPLIGLDLLIRRKFKEMFLYAGAVVAMLLALGLLDLFTWGGFLHSFIEYVNYNLIEHGNADHGVMASDFYWTKSMVERFGLALWPCLAGSLVIFWRHWRMLVAWIVPLLAFSLIDHKEERFLLSIWPFFLIGAFNGFIQIALWASALLRRQTPTTQRAFTLGLSAALLLAVLVCNFLGTQKLPMRWKADVYQAQSWTGAQADASGVLIDDRSHLNGGYTLLHRNIPQVPFNLRLANQPLFNYCILYKQRHVDWIKRTKRYELLEQFGRVSVFRRR